MKSPRFVMDGVCCALGAAIFLFFTGTEAPGQDSPGFQPAPVSSPRLVLSNTSEGLVISWPLVLREWVLEQTAELQRTMRWDRVTGPIQETKGSLRIVRLLPSSPNRFFRLRNQAPPALGLSAHWSLDESEGAIAAARGNPAASMVLERGAWTTGRVGPASLQFTQGATGTRASMSNSNHELLPPTGRPFSASFWFAVDSLPIGTQSLLGNDLTGSNGWYLAVQTVGMGTNELMLTSRGPEGMFTVNGGVRLLPGQWRQLTLTYTGDVSRIYLDRILVASGPGIPSLAAGPIFFGTGVGGHLGWNGRLDDVRFYTNALSDTEIALTAQWHFDEDGGTFATDVSGSGHHADITEPMSWTEGRVGSAVNVSQHPVLITNDDQGVLPPTGSSFGVSLWIRPENLVTGQQGLISCEDGTQSGWRLAVERDGAGKTFLHWSSTNGGGTLDFRVPAGLTNGTWSKVDLNFNGGIAGLFLNGAAITTDGGAICSSRSPLQLGAVPGLPNFPGWIDEVSVFGRERDVSEIGPVARPLWDTVLVGMSTNLVLPGFGPSGKPLTYTILDLMTPTNGTVSQLPGSPMVTYQAGTRKGPDAFAYTVSDGEFTTAPAIVNLSVVRPHWLSPAGGSPPSDGSAPDRAWAAGAAESLDAIWRTNAYYDCFFYEPGTYETRGWRFLERSTANTGCKHIGSGADGANATVLRLVNVWESLAEGIIFGVWHTSVTCNGFEVHQMKLDCNAANLPKFEPGRPEWMRIPLVSNAMVSAVTLRWRDSFLAGVPNWRTGRAAEFDVAALRQGTNGYQTNRQSMLSTGLVDIVSIGTNASEIVLQFTRRVAGVGLYGLAEVEVSGARVSLPRALTPGGATSQLSPGGPGFSPLHLADDDPGTVWASAAEPEVEIVLPLPPGSVVNRVLFQWFCQTLTGLGRLGPATEYQVSARDESTGAYFPVPLIRLPRDAGGFENAWFGTAQGATNVITDELRIRLIARETGVNHYSAREITLLRDGSPVALRIPTVSASTPGSVKALQAFDEAADTAWVSVTQGAASAIWAAGSNMKFSHLKVVGFGTRSGKECFPLYIASPSVSPPAVMGNIVVEDCLFTDPAPNNSDGLTTLHISGNTVNSISNAVIRRCVVRGVRSHFVYSHGYSAVHIENSVAEDCSDAVTYEPEAGVSFPQPPILIRSNSFINVGQGIGLLTHPRTTYNSIVCLDNDIALTTSGAWGIVNYDSGEIGPTGILTNLVCLNNVIRYLDWSPQPARAEGGLHHSNIRHAVYGNNLVALGTSNALRIRDCPAGLIYPPGEIVDCDHPATGIPPDPPYRPPCLDVLPPGYRRAWFNNRDGEGRLLDVRIRNYNVEQLAQQQQWPD